MINNLEMHIKMTIISGCFVGLILSYVFFDVTKSISFLGLMNLFGFITLITYFDLYVTWSLKTHKRKRRRS